MKPCSLEEPQAEQWGAEVGLRSVHLEHAHELKSGLEGDAGVKRTDSPTRSITSPEEEDEDEEEEAEDDVVAVEQVERMVERQVSQRPPPNPEQPGHFQEGGEVMGVCVCA